MHPDTERKLLEDAIETAIQVERDNIKLRRGILLSCMACVFFALTSVYGLWTKL